LVLLWVLLLCGASSFKLRCRHFRLSISNGVVFVIVVVSSCYLLFVSF